MDVEGLIATMKIVAFGIIIGFLIGIILAMCKTAPTSLKDMVESNLENASLDLASNTFISNLLKISNIFINRDNSIFFYIFILLIINLAKNRKSDNSGEKEGFIGLIVPKNIEYYLYVF